MSAVITIALSILAAGVAAGFVWFGWGIVENVSVLRARKRAALAAAAIEAEADAEESEEDED